MRLYALVCAAEHKTRVTRVHMQAEGRASDIREGEVLCHADHDKGADLVVERARGQAHGALVVRQLVQVNRLVLRRRQKN